MNLVIVESPTKARKLKEYLGKNFKIEASVGHVRDLPKKKLGVDVENNFEPEYEVSPDKKKVVGQLRKLANQADAVYLAMDPDREGEAIAWHVKHLLEEKSKKNTQFLRATFHEITKSAVNAAINKPGDISIHLVDAQQARRVLDRLVGYKLSPVLWRKVRRGLSAGRVQSVALRLIVEREKEIAAFKPDEYWEVDTLLSVNKKFVKPDSSPLANQSETSDTQSQKPEWMNQAPQDMMVARAIEIDSKKYQPEKESDVTGVVTFLEKAEYQIASVERKQRKRVSLPPFTTSTLQQTAATRLGFTSKQTMALAQQLYEEGLITYHRTDSVNLSSQAISSARTYISGRFGDKYLPEKPRLFRGKSKNAQEAHEAIRVTDVSVQRDAIAQVSSRFGERHQRLYDLIWRRFVASQMATAVYDSTTVLFDATNAATSNSTAASASKQPINLVKLKSTGSVLKFEGWMKLFPSGSDTLLPDVTQGQELWFVDLHAAQKFTQPPPRYNDASLVKELEKRGIGRPSTYSSIISVIENRGYVTRDQKRFVATPVGTTVSDFLVKHFEGIMDYDFTAEMEEDLDRISRGEKEWRKIISEFYTPFEKKLTTVAEKAERAQIPVEKTGESCPKCGKEDNGEIVIRSGRYGKFKSCSRFPDCDFTENIVEKVDGMNCPVCGKGEVILKPTRWGKKFYGCSQYPDCDWASWSEPKPDLKLTKKEWQEIKKKRAERSEKRKATMAGKKKKAGKKSKTKKKTTKAKAKTTKTAPKKKATKSKK